MATVVIMPKQGQSVESCIIASIKQKGEEVKKGDILFAYETDKASFNILCCHEIYCSKLDTCIVYLSLTYKPVFGLARIFNYEIMPFEVGKRLCCTSGCAS